MNASIYVTTVISKLKKKRSEAKVKDMLIPLFLLLFFEPVPFLFHPLSFFVPLNVVLSVIYPVFFIAN